MQLSPGIAAIAWQFLVIGAHVPHKDGTVGWLSSYLLQVPANKYLFEQAGTVSFHKDVQLALRSGGCEEHVVSDCRE